jgi:hypothetical protein
MSNRIVSSKRLLAAAAEYHEDGSDHDDYERQQDSYNQKILTERRDFFNSSERMGDLLAVLREWKATRFKGATTKVPRVLRAWIPSNLVALRRLGKLRVETLSDSDIRKISELADDLLARGIKPTCFGKTIAFLLPETALIWDDLVVRRLFEFEPTPSAYGEYHRMVRNLARHLIRAEGRSTIRRIESTHAKAAGVREPFAKIVDELAYERAWVLFAMKEIGQWPLDSTA